MEVETYEAIETMGDGSVECDPEALALIESLDLEGQKKLVTKTDDGETVRSPYRKMTAAEKIVYEAILPRKVALSKYEDGPIPLRVLQVAAHARPLFDHIVIRCPANADDPDPLLLGVNGPDYSPREIFLLARWGEVLEPFEKLVAKACDMLRGRRKASLQKVMVECEAAINQCDKMPDSVVLEGECKAAELWNR